MRHELTIEEASVRAQRCARTISQALADGELRGRRKGRRVYISRRELDAWANDKGIRIADMTTSDELFELARQLVREARGKEAA